MAEDLNVVTLVGRLTRDAELSYTRSEIPLLRFSLAVNRRRRSGDDWVDEANFFDLVYWGGRRAEALHRYLQKGQQVSITGQLRQEKWEQQDGQRRSRVQIEVSGLQLLGGRSDAAASRREDGSNVYTDPPPTRSPQRETRRGGEDTPPAVAPPRFQPPPPPKDQPIRDFEDDVPF